MNMEAKIREIFQSAQKLPRIPKCVTSLVKLYNENEATFRNEFIRCVKLTLQSNGDIKCLVEFIVKFFKAILKESEKLDEVNNEDNHSGCDEIGVELFGHESFEGRAMVSQSQSLVDELLRDTVVPYLDSCLVDVRVNSCFFVKSLFMEIDDVDDKVYNDLKQHLLQRISDKNAGVRARAAAALCRFQDTENAKDVVTSAYRFHLKNDPSFEVRLAALLALDPTKDTIKDIITRTRDVKDIIRKSAYIKLAERIHVKSFTIEQRLSILKNGLNDRNPNVRKVVETKLVDSWVKAYNNDIVDLLIALDIQSDTETAEKLVNVICKRYLDQETNNATFLHVYIGEFQKQVLDTRKLLTKVPLTVERSFLWKCLLKFCKDNDDAINEKTKRASVAGNEEAEAVAEIDEMMAGIEVQETETSVTGERGCISQESVCDVSKASSSDMFKDVNAAKRIVSEDDLLDSILPQLPHFCNYLNKFATKIDKNEFSLEQLMDFEFMYHQLMDILLNYEIGDDAQQNIMEKLTLTMLCAESLGVKFHDYITPIMKCLANNVFPASSLLLDFTAEATSKVYNNLAALEESRFCQVETKTVDPAVQRDNEMKYAKVSVEIEEMRDKLEEARKSEDYITAQSLKEEINILMEEKKRIQNQLMNASCATSTSSQATQSQRTVAINLSDHPKDLFKCLQIFCGCLEFGEFPEVNDTIQTHVDKIVIPGILSNEPRIRCVAVKALGICCLISSDMVTRYFALFVQILKRDVEKVQITALKSIFDFLCQHGVRVLVNGQSERDKNETSPVVDKSKLDIDLDTDAIPETPENNGNDSNTEEDVMESLNRLLTDQLRTDSEDLRYVAVQGIAKLLLLGRLYSPSFLSKLILQWYHPDSSSEIKQFLGTFLPIYAFSEAKYGPNSDCTLSGQTALEECFMNTVEAIYIAKNSFNDSRRSSSMEVEIDLAEVDLDNVIAFIVQLMSEEIHPRVAISVCQKMMDIVGLTSVSKYNKQLELLLKYLPKVLITLSLADASKQQLKDMRILMRKILSALGKRMDLQAKNVRTVMKRFEKFTDRVNMFLDKVASQDSMLNLSQISTASANNTLNETVIENTNVVINTDETTEPMDDTIIDSAAAVFEKEQVI